MTKGSAPPPLISKHEAITLLGGAVAPISTNQYFDSTAPKTQDSAIDRFIENCNDINRYLLAPYMSGTPLLPAEVGSVALLGFVSAVESYFRAMISGLVKFDAYTQFIVEAKSVSYGAAVHHDSEMLPEALLEEVSFAGRTNLTDALNQFLRVRVAQNADLAPPLSNYQRICEIRHCCVHRFGRLGSRNAIKLGLASHRDVLEKPLRMNISQVTEAALALRILVKAVNSTVFKIVIERTASGLITENGQTFDYPEKWVWKRNVDRRRFKKYYDHFASLKDSPPSPTEVEVYESFRAACRAR